MKPIIAAIVMGVGIAAPALAVEPARNSFLLWSAMGDYQDRDARALFNIDLDPAQPGLETIGLAESCSIGPRDADDKITVTYKLNFSAKTASGSAQVFATTAAQASTVTSGRFPDPRVARFQCGGANQTRYGVDGDGDDLGVPDPSPGVQPDCGSSGHGFNSGNPGEALCDHLPQVFNVGAGIATKGSTRVFLVGNAARGSYQNNLESDTDFSRFNIAGYEMSGARLWSKGFSAFDGAGFFLQWQYSGVGDYLDNGANVDEIRLVYTASTASSLKLKYAYYDVQTGAAILPSVTVTTHCPGPCRND